ncbi:helix-turn-helix domain-containing protein [Virgibacillus senegalensis]|uniref:helix-turn-helix domain-containing protein n=1 Tax=Virgibacillus senegalensis TaxID=1499679 RepID=UPI00069F7265|nr:helix-turn-helix domain-containing protein [Virgibacillus senegalensis]
MLTEIILDSLSKLNQERSSAAVYHLLVGKRSSQTLQDAHIYHLTGYFGLAKGMEKQAFDEKIAKLVSKQYVHQTGDFVTVTEAGRSFLKSRVKSGNLDHFHGLVYDRVSDIFYERLSLFIQTATNIVSGNHRFIPVTDNQEVLHWLKKYYAANRHRLEEILNQLYGELLVYLNRLPEQYAEIFVKRLSGFSHIGLSKVQLAASYEMDKYEFLVVYQWILHRLLNYVTDENIPTPVLATFARGLVREVFLTDSARKTNELLKQGMDVKEICRIRRLKESTVHDHLIEIAYANPQFPLDNYVSPEAVREITGQMERLSSRKLKHIKQALNDRYTYLQIRLVLAIYREGWQKEWKHDG